ncbi:MAG: alpha-glucosidase C-terminal domain-containing protein [Anaerolineae bacterium]|nr:alpha-glucosidase C-terminal domain-containing protein [Anaerolineae bacterium]
MTGPAWVKNAVFYQIFPERFANGDTSNDPPNAADWATGQPTRENFFGGDLAGITQHVPYLRDLGINALYLTPIFSAASNHKYDTHDYLTIDPSFGTLDSFREMRDALKGAGVRLVLDAVFNHCGDGFWAFRDVIERGAVSPYYDWFQIESWPIVFDPPSYQTCGGAPFLPKLNTENPAVREHLLHVAEYWLAHGIDGWRLDVPWKASLDFWQQFYARVMAVNPEAYVVAEVWRGAADWMNSGRAHGIMNYRLRQNILDYAAFDHMDAEDLDYELHYLLRDYGETAPYHLSLLGSHDTARIRTLCGSVERTIIAIALQMTLPGTPMIYYGDEIGMEGDNDPDCRRPMIWDEGRWNRPIHDATRALIQLRHAHPALAEGDLRTLRMFNGVYAYARALGDDQVIVVLNPRGAQPDLAVPLGELAGTRRWLDILSGMQFTVEQDRLHFRPLRARSAHVLIPISEA